MLQLPKYMKFCYLLLLKKNPFTTTIRLPATTVSGSSPWHCIITSGCARATPNSHAAVNSRWKTIKLFAGQGVFCLILCKLQKDLYNPHLLRFRNRISHQTTAGSPAKPRDTSRSCRRHGDREFEHHATATIRRPHGPDGRRLPARAGQKTDPDDFRWGGHWHWPFFRRR